MSMKYMHIEGEGRTARLRPAFTALEGISENEVRIKVRAAGVNRADLFQREGNYPPPPGASPILGLEVAGDIVECGAAVSHWKVGDEVCALLDGGGYAEYVTVHENLLLPIPTGFSYVEAASLPETYATVWSNLFFHAHMKPGESLLLHGGSSGIGTTAIQVAKAFGITCYATTGDEHKKEALNALGAVRVIHYKQEDFVSIVKELTDGKGVDVVLDMIGGDYFQKNFSALAWQGRLICIAFLKGAKSEVNFGPMLMKNLTLMGSTLRNQPLEYKTRVIKALQDKVWPLLEKGALKPTIDTVFPLEKADDAHHYMEKNEHIGKIILQCAE